MRDKKSASLTRGYIRRTGDHAPYPSRYKLPFRLGKRVRTLGGCQSRGSRPERIIADAPPYCTETHFYLASDVQITLASDMQITLVVILFAVIVMRCMLLCCALFVILVFSSFVSLLHFSGFEQQYGVVPVVFSFLEVFLYLVTTPCVVGLDAIGTKHAQKEKVNTLL